MRHFLCFAAFGFVILAGAQDQQKAIKHSPAQPTLLASDLEMFLAYCAACHGKDAKGDGPAASVLKIAPADLTGLTRKYGQYPAMKITSVLTGQANLAAQGTPKCRFGDQSSRV